MQTTLAAGGLLAAFGVASCCALPVALSMLGIGTASLIGIGYLAAQVQPELLYAAFGCLCGAALVIWWRWRVKRTCATASRRILAWGAAVAIVLSIGLLGLTFWVEPPL